MKTMQSIKKEMVLKAPRQVVWNALTTTEGWTGWFSKGVEGKFEVGETIVMAFGEDGTCEGLIVEKVAMDAFAYQWHPGSSRTLDDHPRDQLTTVRFELADHPSGTILTMTESGFENIPAERAAECVEMNTKGWEWELSELQTFVDQGVRQTGDSSCSGHSQ